MSTHVIQVRDLVTDLLRHRQEAPCEIAIEGSENHILNLNGTRKTDKGVVEVLGINSDDIESLQEQYNELEQLEGRAEALLERFDKIMGGEVATNPKDYNDALDDLHEKVKTHLKSR